MAGVNERNADISDWLEEEINKETRATAFVIMRDLTLSAAVDDGFLKGNFNVSIGAPSNYTTDVVDKSGSATVSRNLSIIESAKNIDYPTLYVENNLPYAYRIMEDGYSRDKQTPDKQMSIVIQKAINR